MKKNQSVTKVITAVFAKSALAISCAFAISTAHAASVSLDPASPAPARVGEMVSFDVLLDFSSDSTTGGSVDIAWDPSVLQYNDNFNITLSPRDSTFDVVDFQQPGLLSVGLGDFAGFTPTGVLGVVEYMAMGEGTTDISLGDSQKWGGFFSSTGALIPVNYAGSQVSVSAVPVPAAVWLFSSGLVGLAGMARRKSATI